MIKSAVGAFFRGGLRKQWAKQLFMEKPSIRFATLLQMEALRRPAHAYCMYGAARLAQRLGLPKISVAEFGVAGGNTLLVIEDYAERIERETGVEIEVYGFDTSEGLPEIIDHRDMPYWFQPGQFAMDFDALQKRLKRAKLVIGNIDDTIGTFEEKYNPAPLGAIFCDVDLYSGSIYTLRSLDMSDKSVMPRAFVYMDDVEGTEWEMYGPFNGELEAINEFNETHERKKIHLNQNLMSSSRSFRYKIYYAHLFDHPLYNKYVGANDQEEIMALLRLNG